MTLSEKIENYQQILTGYDADGNKIKIHENRLEFIDVELIDENVSKKAIDLVAIVRSRLDNLNFADCTLEDSLIFENLMNDVKMNRCSLEESQFRDNTTTKLVFRDCNLSKIQFSGSTFTDTVFIDCQMNWASFNHVTFENCVLKNIDLTGVTLNDVQFNNCEISNCKSIGEYKISVIENPAGKVGESHDILDLI